jgi:hypothetical protein
MTIQDFDIQVATAQHVDYAPLITDEMAESAKARGTGIAQRSPEYVANKMLEGKAVIALHKDGTWAGFCYIELSRTKYPEAKLFGLTTGLAVMKINSELGYEPVTYSELTQDEEFWKGCRSCVNYDILTMKERKNCMCTAMLFDPVEKAKDAERKKEELLAAENLEKMTKKATLFQKIESAIKSFGQDIKLF